AWLPRYTTHGSAIWAGHTTGSPDVAELPAGPYEATDSHCSTRMRSAVLNRLVEARIFRFDRPLTAEEVTVRLLCSLGLESLRGVAEMNIRAGRVQPQDAFKVLFSAASRGGAYTDGLAGAYGRLAAWESMAGLAGAPDE